MPVTTETELEEALATVKKELRLADRHCFKHQGSSERRREVFFCHIARLPLCFDANVIDKNCLPESYFKQRDGKEQIADGIVDLIHSCHEEFVAGQVLMIDLPRSEKQFVQQIRQAVRASLRGRGRTSYSDIRACPDHRGYGALVQVADMVAGELREYGGVGGPHLARIKRRLHLVGETKTPSLVETLTDPLRPVSQNAFATGKNA